MIDNKKTKNKELFYDFFLIKKVFLENIFQLFLVLSICFMIIVLKNNYINMKNDKKIK